MTHRLWLWIIYWDSLAACAMTTTLVFDPAINMPTRVQCAVMAAATFGLGIYSCYVMKKFYGRK